MTNDPTLREQIVSHYGTLDHSGKVIFLAKVAEWMTIEGRGTERSTAGEEAMRMRNILNALHRVIVQLHSMLGSQERYPDEVFAEVLADQLERLEASSGTLRRLLS